MSRTQLFFMPDLILFWQDGSYGGIGYSDFRVEQGLTRFIEDEAVPGDATLVDRTWRYVLRLAEPLAFEAAELEARLLSSVIKSRAQLLYNWTRRAYNRASHSQIPGGRPFSTSMKRARLPSCNTETVRKPRAQSLKMLGLLEGASPDEITLPSPSMFGLDRVIGTQCSRNFKRRGKEYEAINSANGLRHRAQTATYDPTASVDRRSPSGMAKGASSDRRRAIGAKRGW